MIKIWLDLHNIIIIERIYLGRWRPDAAWPDTCGSWPSARSRRPSAPRPSSVQCPVAGCPPAGLPDVAHTGRAVRTGHRLLPVPGRLRTRTAQCDFLAGRPHSAPWARLGTVRRTRRWTRLHPLSAARLWALPRAACCYSFPRWSGTVVRNNTCDVTRGKFFTVFYRDYPQYYCRDQKQKTIWQIFFYIQISKFFSNTF